MAKLDGVTASDLRAALAETSDHKAVRRLMIALAYKDGDSVNQLSQRYGFPHSTVYYWLDRFEKRRLEEALEDEARPGRPRKLADEERDALMEDLATEPGRFGYNVREWTPELLREHIRLTYGVEYSTGHVRRLLREGL